MLERHIKIWWKRLFFVLKAHFLTLFIFFATTVHIGEYVKRQQEDRFEFKRAILVHQNYVLIYFTGFSYWGFLWLTFFRDSMKNFRWWFNFLLMACMAWLSCPLISLSLLSAQLWEWYSAAYIIMALMIIHIAMAMCREPFYDYTPEFLLKWSIRGFVFSSLGILLSIAWKSSHIDVIVSYFMLLYFVILIILFGRTIGSVQFYVNYIEQNEWLYIILIHYNFMSAYALIMLAMCKTRCVLHDDLTIRNSIPDQRT